VAPASFATAAPAPANPLQALNAAVVGFFERADTWLSTLPGGPLSDFVSGALLLVRRTLFNQLPTAHPYQFSTKANGQLVGTLGVVDAEGDALTYSLSTVPQSGTVQIAPDGIWTYTPGPDFAYGVPESFTVTVNARGFNILNPGGGPLEVTVPVGLASGSTYLRRQYYIQNVTVSPVVYQGAIDGEPQNADSRWRKDDIIYRQPPIGYAIQPGEQVEINFNDVTLDTHIYTLVGLRGLGSDADRFWSLNYNYSDIDRGLAFACDSTSGNAGCAKSGIERDNLVDTSPHRALIGDAPGVYPYNRDTPGAEDALAKLTQMAANYVDGLTVQWIKIDFQNQPAGAQGWVVKSPAADNPSDNTNSRSYTVTDSASTTEGSSWKVGGGVKWSPIEKVLEFAVNGEYGKNYSSTTAKTFTTTFTQPIPPWSANEILQQPPIMRATGDAEFSFPGLGVTYRFRTMDFLIPSQTIDTPFYQFRTEPLQPKDDKGKPIANVGFVLKDPKSDDLEPTYQAGTQRQLSLKAYNGIATSQAGFEKRSVWTSTDEKVVSVDSVGKLTANAPGTATITARYDWVIPLGGGGTRHDYVLATMKVTVV